MRTNGAYMFKNDKSEDGYYYTVAKDGTIKKNKYGWRDKLHELIKYGTTEPISYSYIRFDTPSRSQSYSEIEVYTGTTQGEFTEVFNSLKYMNPREKKAYWIHDEVIYVGASGNRETRIVISKDEQELYYYYMDGYTHKEVMERYKFYSF